MTEIMEQARRRLLEPTALGDQDLDRLMSQLLSNQVDYADIYFQYSRHETWSLEEGKVKSGSHNIDQGVGIRAISGEKTGFAYSDELVLPALEQAATTAKAIASSGSNRQVPIVWKGDSNRALYAAIDPIPTLADQAKVDLLEKVEAEARKQDVRVSQVMAGLSSVQDVVLVAASDGTLAADIRPLVRLNVTVIVDDNGKREQGTSGGGGRFGLTVFTDTDQALQYARDAVQQALIKLEAKAPPAGMMPVVLGHGWPGILLHEAIGHGLEGDFNRKGTSAFSGRIGERVASDLCTVVDDATLTDRRGSLSIDDEGTAGQNTVLIENGILKGYMQDKMNARLMGMAATGNGRRESYSHLPMPRMTNTYMLAGETDPEEIIGSVEKGLYAANFGGGQVDITSGKFVFTSSEAYMIENGKITYPVKGATLIGSGPEVLTQVSMVGNDLELDSGVGVCGKDGQSVPVGVGQPTLKIDQLTVGGTEI
ncbi:MAG: metalloprotease TldD [Gammaproteobacteria bacterium]|nr:metalloprotease TldD [Gammaproteobacteria bacterium]MDX2487494.1 metalloprotease TldD [Gammaproteobacteria bacterium]